MSFVVVLITAKDEEQAVMIARALVEQKLAACCNIIKGVRSIYRWKNKIEDDTEVLLIVKTKQELFSTLTVEVQRLHSYSTPEMIVLPIGDISEPYRQWLEGSLS